VRTPQHPGRRNTAMELSPIAHSELEVRAPAPTCPGDYWKSICSVRAMASTGHVSYTIGMTRLVKNTRLNPPSTRWSVST
jgi:hypothetical protein